MRGFKNISLILLSVILIGVGGFTFYLHDRYVVPILMYHHVGIPSGSRWRLNSVKTNSFDLQLRFLRRHGFKVVNLDDVINGIKAGNAFSRNSVVITFDDGYEDNYKYAFPLLKKYHTPATIFLISDLVGKPGFLTWDQIKEMEKYGITFGGHTRHHVYLPDMDELQLRDETAGCKSIIEGHLGHPIDYFAYPTGGFTEATKEILRNSGYKAAVTTNRGKDKFNQDLFELKRIHMNNNDMQFSGLIMWFKLSGYYNLFRESKKSGGFNRRYTYD